MIYFHNWGILSAHITGTTIKRQKQRKVMERRRSTSWRRLIRQGFPWRRFVVGAVIPILIFYACQRFDQTLTGAVLAGGWGLGVIAAGYGRSRRIDLFAGLATTLAAIELIGTLVTRNPSFYLASTAIDSALYGVVFLGSLLLTRPLIQVLVEAGGAEIGSKQFRHSRLYRSAWQVLTALWGIVYLLKAILLLLFQIWLSLETFLALRTLSGIPVFVLLMAFSYWFPSWYWNRRKVKREPLPNDG